MKNTLRKYYSLTKPGVTYGNSFSAVAGYIFAAGMQLELVSFLAFTLGITFVIASACVLNNFLDRDIDQHMTRTSKRVSVTGEVSPVRMVIFSAVLGVVGLALIYAFTTVLATWVALFGFATYVVLYGMLSKRLSMHGTLVGSISGAAPILAGYVAVSGQFDAAAWILFAVLFFWQMPEFYSIAIYRQKEYAAAGVPVISVVKGATTTTRHIWWYTLAFVISVVALSVSGYAGWVYTSLMIIASSYWLGLASQGVTNRGDESWSRKMFRVSLIMLMAFCFLIILEPWLP